MGEQVAARLKTSQTETGRRAGSRKRHEIERSGEILITWSSGETLL